MPRTKWQWHGTKNRGSVVYEQLGLYNFNKIIVLNLVPSNKKKQNTLLQFCYRMLANNLELVQFLIPNLLSRTVWANIMYY